MNNTKVTNLLKWSCLLGFALLSACRETVYTPKPRAYPKINFPEQGYQQFDEQYCHFTFEYPSYASIQQDTAFFDEKPVDPCWFDVYIPALNCRWYFSYIPIEKKEKLDSLRRDAFVLADKHLVKAEYKDEIPVKNADRNIEGMLFKIDGPVASPFQFFLTDGNKHFVRGSLYFNTQANKPDSLAPVVQFMEKEMLHLIETFEWEK